MRTCWESTTFTKHIHSLPPCLVLLLLPVFEIPKEKKNNQDKEKCVLELQTIEKRNAGAPCSSPNQQHDPVTICLPETGPRVRPPKTNKHGNYNSC